MITIECAFCRGSGYDTTGMMSTPKCPVCKGVKTNHIFFNDPVECPDCLGGGKGAEGMFSGPKPCKTCKGTGVVR